MAVQSIIRIENILDNDASSPSGQRIVGFKTYYDNSRFIYSEAYLGQHSIYLVTSEATEYEVHYDQSIEAIDIYNSQFGVALSEDHSCLFITSWLHGVFCFDLFSGELKWNFHLKHAQQIVQYSNFLLCDFQELGIRKISYDGSELARYQMTTYDAFFALDEPYFLIGPKREQYHIVDSSNMLLQCKVKKSSIVNTDDTLILLSATGNLQRLTVHGYQSEQLFTKEIDLLT